MSACLVCGCETVCRWCGGLVGAGLFAGALVGDPITCLCRGTGLSHTHSRRERRRARRRLIDSDRVRLSGWLQTEAQRETKKRDAASPWHRRERKHPHAREPYRADFDVLRLRLDHAARMEHLRDHTPREAFASWEVG